jgi:REP element-mobilizing transposase RayT
MAALQERQRMLLEVSTISHSIRSRGYLPHWESEHATYFVTFRLADSLPRDLLERLRQERDILDRVIQARSAGFQPAAADQDRARKLRAILQKAEQCLDDGLGRCYMRDFRIAKIVADTIRHFHGQRYCLWAWCIMPNHVHVIFSPLGEHTLESILHSWKSYSALEANKLLGRTGRFWQREYFDHLVRNEASLLKITRYVRENPEKAGLCDWPWVEVLA